jgi:predicted ATPase
MLGVFRVGYQRCGADQREGGQQHAQGEDRRPGEDLQQSARDQEADERPGSGHGGPHSHRSGTLRGREHAGDDRERHRHDHRCAHPRDGPERDQRARAGHEDRPRRSRPKEQQPEQLLAAERFPDGVYFVPLPPLDAAEQIVPALAQALGFPLDGGKQPARSPRQQVFDYLRARRLLLVLDNIEHLLSGAEEGDAADLVAALLDNVPGLAIPATSRERLQLRAEHVYPLEGLDMSSTAAPDHSSAVALFVQRARRLRPDFGPARDQLDAVARICRQLDGMPLAIELAAGWVDTLAPADIAAALERGLDLLATEFRDMPARHRSLRAIVDASHQRLSRSEQAVFARLAIFRGGGTLAAVQAITQATLPLLQVLIGASLLSYDTTRGRYTLQELLRQYALEKLGAEAGDELWTRDQHAAYYLAFVQQHGADLAGSDQQAALAALDAERDNVRAGWAWAAKRGRVDLLARAADGLGYFSEWRGATADGERAYQGAASRLEAQRADDEARCILAQLRAWQGNFRRLPGDVVGAEQLLRQSMALLEHASTSQDTRAERAFVLMQLGLVAEEGTLEDARHSFEESLALYQALERRWEASQVLLWLGDLARYQGAFADARRCFRDSLAIRGAEDSTARDLRRTSVRDNCMTAGRWCRLAEGTRAPLTGSRACERRCSVSGISLTAHASCS